MRRFSAPNGSLGFFSRDFPYPTAIRSSLGMPKFSVRNCFTASARRSDKSRVYAPPPRASVCPAMRNTFPFKAGSVRAVPSFLSADLLDDKISAVLYAKRISRSIFGFSIPETIGGVGVLSACWRVPVRTDSVDEALFLHTPREKLARTARNGFQCVQKFLLGGPLLGERGSRSMALASSIKRRLGHCTESERNARKRGREMSPPSHLKNTPTSVPRQGTAGCRPPSTETLPAPTVTRKVSVTYLAPGVAVIGVVVESVLPIRKPRS